MKSPIIAALFLTGPVLLAGCAEQPRPIANVPGDKPSTVIIPFLGSTHDAKGIKLPEAIHGPGVSGYDISEPCSLEIMVPGRRPIRLDTVRASILATDGIIEGVFIWRPRQPLGFKDVVADLNKTLTDQGIAPERIMKQQMKTWPQDQPDQKGNLFPIPYQTGTDAFGEVGAVHVRVSPSAEGGWFYMWEIGAKIKATDVTRITDPESPKQAVTVRGPEVGRLQARRPLPTSVFRSRANPSASRAPARRDRPGCAARRAGWQARHRQAPPPTCHHNRTAPRQAAVAAGGGIPRSRSPMAS